MNISSNFPRFFRAKDTVFISAKVTNLSQKSLTGNIQLQFTNEETQNKVSLVLDTDAIKKFKIGPDTNMVVQWKVFIPEGISAVRYRIVAQAGNFADGQENTIPVLSNRIFITESFPIWVNPHSIKKATFQSLKTSKSESITNHRLIFEFTGNPAWTTLKSLPYLMEFPYECSEQAFARYFANILAGKLLRSNPAIEKAVQKWQVKDSSLTGLGKKPALKNIAIEETPWLKTAQSKAEQQKRLADLLNAKKSAEKAEATLLKLKEMQLPSGGFPWFSGGPANRFISLHILTGLGHLKKLAPKVVQSKNYEKIVKKLILFLDNQYQVKSKEGKNLETASLLYYLYARSFF